MFSLSQSQLKWLIFLIISAISIFSFTCLFPTSAQKLAQVDENIRQLRTGNLIIKVVNQKQQPIVGAVVNLQQTKHHFEFGTALSTEMFSDKVNQQDKDKYLGLVKQLFNTTAHENALKWYATEPNQGQISYADADRILKWSRDNDIKMRGHALFWAVEQYNQDWVKSLNNRELKQVIQKRSLDVCRRYRGQISEYDVINEMLHGDFYQKRLGESIVDSIFRWCHQADPSARLYVNDYNILNGKELNRYVKQIRSLRKRGVLIGGIGIQGHIREKISPQRVQQTLDTLAQFKLPIKITEFDVVADTEEEKAQILKDVYRVTFAHPSVQGILMWGFWQQAHWEPKAALYTKDWQLLPAAQAYQDLVYNNWWTKINTVTNKAGEVRIRAFFGKYRLNVNAQNKTKEQAFSVLPGKKTQIVIKL
ncbi:MAG: endo-1,4-beta-xylanase [Spirirestis rafaelensis WJT71-NPBG6]|jgi:GH35 family endo-1,4-beta-xylanase|nr:endo-1,4-beta-xylanase [Spirirestis rafaelensis WJT71-NPBG6]